MGQTSQSVYRCCCVVVAHRLAVTHTEYMNQAKVDNANRLKDNRNMKIKMEQKLIDYVNGR